MAKYIIARDVGTSGDKAVLVDTEGRVHGKCFEPYKTYYPSPGCVEQEPRGWWQAVSKTTRLLRPRPSEKKQTKGGESTGRPFAVALLRLGGPGFYWPSPNLRSFVWFFGYSAFWRNQENEFEG